MGDTTPTNMAVEATPEKTKLNVDNKLTPKITEMAIKGKGEPLETSLEQKAETSAIEEKESVKEEPPTELSPNRNEETAEGTNIADKEENLKNTQGDDAAKTEVPVLEIKPEAKGDKFEDVESFISTKSMISRTSTNSCINRPSSSTLDRYVARQQSDILPSLRELPTDEDASNMIFSNKGLPSNARKQAQRRRDLDATVSEQRHASKKKSSLELTPKISQTVPHLAGETASPRGSLSRNVLTGSGVISQDEFKCKSARRRDGNPLLGLGYDEPATTKNPSRVPPGGYSKGLW